MADATDRIRSTTTTTKKTLGVKTTALETALLRLKQNENLRPNEPRAGQHPLSAEFFQQNIRFDLRFSLLMLKYRHTWMQFRKMNLP